MRSDQSPSFPTLLEDLFRQYAGIRHQFAYAVHRGGETAVRKALRLLFPYLPLEELLMLMKREHARPCNRFLNDRYGAFITAPGSRTKHHQAWLGGYQAHIAEGMNLAIVLYTILNTLRPLPFSLSSLLFVFFWHDAEKLDKYDEHTGERIVVEGLRTKEAERIHHESLLDRYNVVMTDEEAIALRYAEGEGASYDRDKRVMNELGALVHACDVLSARLWHDHPQQNDPWQGSERYAANP